MEADPDNHVKLTAVTTEKRLPDGVGCLFLFPGDGANADAVGEFVNGMGAKGIGSGGIAIHGVFSMDILRTKKAVGTGGVTINVSHLGEDTYGLVQLWRREQAAGGTVKKPASNALWAPIRSESRQ